MGGVRCEGRDGPASVENQSHFSSGLFLINLSVLTNGLGYMSGSRGGLILTYL